MNYYQKQSQGLTVYIDGKGSSISSDAPQYTELLAACRAGNWPKAKKLMSVKSLFNENGIRIRIVNENIIYQGVDKTEQVLAGPLVDRIFKAFKQGGTTNAIKPLMVFMDNVMRNPHKDIREELYEFLQSGAMPITNDGCFLAYKKVRNDYFDIYSGKLDNSPGKLVTMPATECGDTNRNELCSHGLHFCARNYLSSYSVNNNNKVVVVKVNPRHVFAIPRDHSFTKGRASEYYVIGECKGDVYKDEHFIKAIVYDEDMLSGTATDNKVEFVKELRPSIKTIAAGFGLITGDEVYVQTSNARGVVPVEKYDVVRDVEGVWTSAITKKPVPYEYLSTMSITTKSVRSAVVRAISKLRKANNK